MTAKFYDIGAQEKNCVVVCKCSSRDKFMQLSWHLLETSMQEVARNPNLPIMIATCAGVSVACFAVGLLWMLRHTPIAPPAEPELPSKPKLA